MAEEKLGYYEAKSWFWTRTFVWLVPAIIVTAISQYMLWSYFDLSGTMSVRLWTSIAGGFGSTLIGLLGAAISLDLPWMRLGRRYGYVLNGPVSGFFSGVAAFLLCGAILSIMQNDPNHPPSQATVQMAYILMEFSIGASIFWGFILGSWFAMRRDKYFIEQI